MSSYTEEALLHRLKQLKSRMDFTQSGFDACAKKIESYKTIDFLEKPHWSLAQRHAHPYYQMQAIIKKTTIAATKGVLKGEVSRVQNQKQSQTKFFKADLLKFCMDQEPPSALTFSLVMLVMMTHNTGINFLDLNKTAAPESQLFAKLMSQATQSDLSAQALEQREQELITFYKKRMIKILLRHVSQWHKKEAEICSGRIHPGPYDLEKTNSIIKSLVFPEYNRFARSAVKKIMGHDRNSNYLPPDVRLRTLSAVLASFCVSIPARLYELMSRYYQMNLIYSLPSFVPMQGPRLLQAMLRELNLYSKDRGLQVDITLPLKSIEKMYTYGTQTMGSVALTYSGREQFLRSRPPAESFPEAVPSLMAAFQDPNQICFISIFDTPFNGDRDAPEKDGRIHLAMKPGTKPPPNARKIDSWTITGDEFLGISMKKLPRLIEEAYDLQPGTILGTCIINKYRLRIDEAFILEDHIKVSRPQSVFLVKGLGPLESLIGLYLEYERVEQLNAGI